jgi:hypothetical protein
MSEKQTQHQAHKDRERRIREAAWHPPIPKPEPEPEPPPKPQYISIFDIILRHVCLRYNVSRSDLLSKRRLGKLVIARRALVIMLYRFTKWSTVRIGGKINRDQGTVSYMIIMNEKNPVDYTDLERAIARSASDLANPLMPASGGNLWRT